jgi:hypothetical protein
MKLITKANYATAVQHTFDLVGGIAYLAVWVSPRNPRVPHINIWYRIVMEIGIVSSHLIWRYRTRHDHRAAKAVGKSYDEYIKSLELPTTESLPRNSNSSSLPSLPLETEKFYNDVEMGHFDYTFKSSKSTESLDVVPPQPEGNEWDPEKGRPLTFNGVLSTQESETYHTGLDRDVSMTVPPPIHVRNGDKDGYGKSQFHEML